MDKSELRLYVWRGACAGGIVVALASSVEEARKQVLAACYYVPQDDIEKEPEVYDTPVAFAQWGE